nr:DUF1045 domain-containing protein [Rhizobium halophytocola]
MTLAAASWLGRSVYSGDAVSHPMLRGLGLDEIAYHTAIPRRLGFHAVLRSPFRLDPEANEQGLLRALMHFASGLEPFELPPLQIGRTGGCLGLFPQRACAPIDLLAQAVVQAVEPFRSPLTEAEIERRDPYSLTAAQLANLHRWGDPDVMDDFRFHMPLTDSLRGADTARFERVMTHHFAPVLGGAVAVRNLALFIEREAGAPFVVHSLHPMGRIAARQIA